MGWNVAQLHQLGTEIKRDSFEPLPAEFQFGGCSKHNVMTRRN
jgi:hypothetical protein